MKPGLKLLLILTAASTLPCALARRPITLEDMARLQRISDPQISPDGKWVAYVQAQVDLAADKNNTHIWLVPAGGGTLRQLTQGSGSDTRPRWSPDSQSVAFISTRGGTSQ